MIKQRGIATDLIIYAVAIAAVLAAVYGAYAYVDSSWETSAGIKKGTATKQAEWDAANLKQRQEEAAKTDKAAGKLEKGNSDAKVIYRTITQQVDKIVTRDIYVRECFDLDGLSTANAALNGTLTPTPKPDSRMPKPDAIGGGNGRSGTTKAD